MHPSIEAMWQEFRSLDAKAGYPAEPVSHWHFCDNQQDADECVLLVLAGRKRATAPSLWSFESHDEPLPRAGDLHVVTDWAGEARCIIRITAVEVVPLDEIGEEHAQAEGEGDGSLSWWLDAHRAYYRRELEGSGQQFQPDMPVVFEWFECVYPAPHAASIRSAAARSPDTLKSNR